MLVEEDLQLRSIGIGGSEVGAIFGCDDYRNAFDIWAVKKGRAERPAPSERMLVGSALEQGVLSLYTIKTGREIAYINRTSRHPARSWMIYTPDAICKHERVGVDAKVVFWDQRRKWGASALEIPQSYVMQAWYYMAAMDYPQWDICALMMGEGFPRVYTIERDEEAERVMLARLDEWHRRYIVGDEHPPFGESKQAAAWLQQAFAHHKRPDMRDADDTEARALDHYVEIVRMSRELAASRRELENSLRNAIADREGLEWAGGRLTWRRSRDSQIVDYKSMALGLLYAHVKDDAQRADLLTQYQSIKAGSRRLHLTCAALDAGDEEQ